MDTTRAVLALAVGLVGFPSGLVHAASTPKLPENAQGIYAEETATTLPKAINFDWTPSITGEPFTLTPTKSKTEQLPDLLLTPHHKPSAKKPKSNAEYKSSKGKDWEKKIIAQIPQAQQLKEAWNFIDGETDLHFKGLRVDRGNKGVKYSTHYVPMIGEMESVEMEFMAGEDMELSLESRHIPFAGELDGFKFKSSVSTSDSKVLARYTIPFD